MKDTTKQSVVYLLQAEGTEFFKIGTTSNLQNRLKGIQNGNPCKILIVKTWSGATAFEREAHRRFSQYQSRGEWFDFSGADIDGIVREMDGLCAARAATSRLTENGELILQTMSDLYSLELSAALLQAADAKMIAPVETTPTMLKFYVSVCRIHQMMMLPACPMCIE